MCQELRCLKPPKEGADDKLECFSLGKPPADGTKCDENMVQCQTVHWQCQKNCATKSFAVVLPREMREIGPET